MTPACARTFMSCRYLISSAMVAVLFEFYRFHHMKLLNKFYDKQACSARVRARRAASPLLCCLHAGTLPTLTRRSVLSVSRGWQLR